MNLIEIAEDLKDVPDQYLMQEVQQPTGNFPAYLVISELSRRKRMRDKVAKEMPTQTVAEELAMPPQPQMAPQMAPQMSPQMASQMAPQGLMGMPQAQTELAAQDAMGTTPPEMMMPAQMMPRMAGGGIVSFKQGGDIPRFQNQGFVNLSDFESLPLYKPPGPRLAGSVGEMFTNMIPSMDTLSGVERRIDPVTGKAVTLGEYMRLQDRRTADTARATLASSSAVPGVDNRALLNQADAALRSQPGEPPPPAVLSVRDPVARSVIPQFRDSPALINQAALTAAGKQGIEEYERAVPDRLTPFLRESITKREGDIEGRRSSNINEALMQAGLGAMRAKPKFSGTAGFFEVLGAGGQEGLNAFRQGAKDIRQSEDALMESRAKMAQAQMLFDQNKLGAAQKARAEAIQLNELGLKRADTENAQIYRTLELGFKERQTAATERARADQSRLIEPQIDLLKAQAEGARTKATMIPEAALKAAEAHARNELMTRKVPIMPGSPNYSIELQAEMQKYLSLTRGIPGLTSPDSGVGGDYSSIVNSSSTVGS